VADLIWVDIRKTRQNKTITSTLPLVNKKNILNGGSPTPIGDTISRHFFIILVLHDEDTTDV
jgi:hypothetical protein